MSFNISLGGSGSAVQIGGFASGGGSGTVGFAVPGAQVAFGSGGVAPPFGMVVQVGGAPVPPLQFGGIYGYEALPADPKGRLRDARQCGGRHCCCNGMALREKDRGRPRTSGRRLLGVG